MPFSTLKIGHSTTIISTEGLPGPQPATVSWTVIKQGWSSGLPGGHPPAEETWMAGSFTEDSAIGVKNLNYT